MSKRLVVFISFLLFFTAFSVNKTYAAGTITLTMRDLTLWNIMPDDSVSSAMQKLKKSYKQLTFDKVEGNYITGDPTPQMAYYLELDTDSKGRVTGIDYEHFVDKNKGLNFATNRGIKVGSSIQTVYSKYGKNPKAEYDKDPGNNYLFLTYPIAVKETKQTGSLIIRTRYGLHSTKSSAKVYAFEYKLNPISASIGQISLTKTYNLYATPGAKKSIGKVSPQTVFVTQKRTDGWYKIITLQGENWIQTNYFSVYTSLSSMQSAYNNNYNKLTKQARDLFDLRIDISKIKWDTNNQFYLDFNTYVPGTYIYGKTNSDGSVRFLAVKRESYGSIPAQGCAFKMIIDSFGENSELIFNGLVKDESYNPKNISPSPDYKQYHVYTNSRLYQDFKWEDGTDLLRVYNLKGYNSHQY